MKISTLHYPALTQYFHLDRLADNTDHAPRVYSRGKGSPSSRVNQALEGIAKDNGKYAYINNRVRENVGARLLQGVTGQSVATNTIVNDVLYGVDMIGRFGSQFHAIDMTCNEATITEKLAHARIDGTVELLNPSEELTSLPFIVMYVSGELLTQVSGALEKYISQQGNPRDTSSISQVVEDAFHLFIRGKGDRISPKQVIHPYMREAKHSESVRSIISQALNEALSLPS